MPSARQSGLSLTLCLGLLLAACASQPKTGMRQPLPPTAPGIPGVKIGKPYEVFGVRYVPRDDRSYDEKGIASWYGPTFHTKPTANGEIYNQEDLTAAHKTLPMPSWVEVTNLENGRKQVVRVNDRGPFVDGRIIDLSRKSAEVLGVERPGIARVRVRRVFPEWDWARQTPVQTAPVQLAQAEQAVPVTTTAPTARDYVDPPLDPVSATRSDMPAAPKPPTPGYIQVPPQVQPVVGTYYIQVAALSDEGRARALASVMADYGPSRVEQTAGGLWRVRIGPLSDTQISNTLYDVQMAGYRDARIVR